MRRGRWPACFKVCSFEANSPLGEKKLPIGREGSLISGFFEFHCPFAGRLASVAFRFENT